MIFYSLLFLVFLSPLPYATNRPWSWSLWAALIALLTIALALEIWLSKRSSHNPHPHKPLTHLIIIFATVILWAFIQTLITIPDSWIHPLWPLMNNALAGDIQGSISLNPTDTVTAIMRLISYALVFCISQHYCQNRDRAKQVFFYLMVTGFLYSLYGLLVHLSVIEPILMPYKYASHAVSSTFINRNHFATYAALTLLCTLALLSESVQISNRYKLGGYIGLQRFFENLIKRTWLPLLAFIFIGTALLLTYSRGGFLSTLVAFFVLLAAFNSNKKTRSIHLLTVFSVFLVIGGWIFYVSGDVLTDRFDFFEDDSAFRSRIYQLTWGAVSDNPWLGYGYGCYQEAFPLYKTIDVAGSNSSPFLWDYAHNTYLEVIFELGIPAALLLFYCQLKITWDCLKCLFIRKRDLIFPATGVAATALVGAHAIVDFSIQLPAVAYTYALLMGAAWAQSFSSRKATV